MCRLRLTISIVVLATGLIGCGGDHDPRQIDDGPVPTLVEQVEPDDRPALLLNVIDNVADRATAADQVEAVSAQIDNQIHHLTDWMLDADRDASILNSIVDTGYLGGPLVPAEMRVVYENTSTLVHRMDQPDRTNSHQNGKGMMGIKGFEQSVESWLSSASLMGARFKFKTVHINVDLADHIETEHLVAFTATTGQKVIEQNATWQAKWTHPSERSPDPKLLAVTLTQFEQVSINTSHPLFRDLTSAVFGSDTGAMKQMMIGAQAWSTRIEKFNRNYIEAHNGITIGDVNGDGLDDVYRCQPGGLPNRLFIRQPDGRVRDASAEAGVDLLDNTDCALLIDLDNDGDQDLVLSLEKNILFMENDGTGRFKIRAKLDLQSAVSMAAADYDHDGDLDLYVCVYTGAEEFDRRAPAPIPYHDATNGERNVLFRNDGNWTLTDVTDEVGLDQNNTKYSFSAVWDDYDNDGDLDLHVANDFGRNNLYRNDDGRFTDVADQAGVEDGAFGMSITIGDYNRDGRNDVYISNMFSSAGNRVTYQRHFKAGSKSDTVQQFQRMARGNSLFENVNGNTFADVSVASGTTIGRWAWGSLFTDLNNDGWEDLIVTNGYITGVQPDDL